LVNFSIDYQTNSLVYGLSGLKGLGIECAKALIENREKFGPYESLIDLTTRLEQNVNKKVLETLAKSGAFDFSHPNRKETLTAIPLALSARKDLAKYSDKIAAFELSQSTKKRKPIPPASFVWPQTPGQSLLELLAGERDAFGFYFSKHPYEYYANELDGIKSCESLRSIADRPVDWEQHMIAGVVTEMRLIDTKSGKFFIATIGDGDTEVEVKAFSTVAKKITEWIKKDAFVIFAVNLREDRLRGSKSIQVTDAIGFEAAKFMLCESLNILVNVDQINNVSLITNQFPGSLPLYLWHPSDNNQLIRSRSPYAYIDKSQSCFDRLEAAFPNFCIKSYLQGRPSTLNHK
jgi:DNA polymerase-3 subunit alpha